MVASISFSVELRWDSSSVPASGTRRARSPLDVIAATWARSRSTRRNVRPAVSQATAPTTAREMAPSMALSRRA